MSAETLSRFYKRGSIVWNSYYRRYELVLDFHFLEGNGVTWYAKVIKCTENGIPSGEMHYKHSRHPTQDCFDGTQHRIRGGKALPGVISPEKRLKPIAGHSEAV